MCDRARVTFSGEVVLGFPSLHRNGPPLMGEVEGLGFKQARFGSARFALFGQTARFSPPAVLLLFLILVSGFLLRAYNLAAEGFGDDEVHKWLAANRYLTLDIVGDDIE